MDDPHDMPKASKKPLTRKQKRDANNDKKELKRFESLGDLIAKKMGLEYLLNLGPFAWLLVFGRALEHIVSTACEGCAS